MINDGLYDSDKARAMRVASEWSIKWKHTPESRALVGREVTIKGERHLFVVFSRSHPKWRIKMVRVSDAQPRRFTIAYEAEVRKQLGMI